MENFIDSIKSNKTTMSRFKTLYWDNVEETKPLKLSDFAKLEFPQQVGYWIGYFEKENIGLDVGIIGYSLAIIKDNQEQFPDMILHSEEFGVKYLKREVFPNDSENGMLTNYKRAIISACELIEQLYGTRPI